MLRAVLFDWGDTLMQWTWDPEFLEEGHRAGLEAIGRGGLPPASALAARFVEAYEPLLWVPGVVEELEYPGLIRDLLRDVGVEVTDDELDRFLRAEHAAWAPSRQLGSTTPAIQNFRSSVRRRWARSRPLMLQSPLLHEADRTTTCLPP